MKNEHISKVCFFAIIGRRFFLIINQIPLLNSYQDQIDILFNVFFDFRLIVNECDLFSTLYPLISE
jgi:hypothetical protein